MLSQRRAVIEGRADTSAPIRWRKLVPRRFHPASHGEQPDNYGHSLRPC